MGEVPYSVKENAQWGDMMVVRMVFSLFRAEEELADLYNYYTVRVYDGGKDGVLLVQGRGGAG